MPKKASEFFSNVDAAWLHMESRTNSAMITGVMTFAEPLNFERVRDTITCRLLSFQRFKQRVHEPFQGVGLPRWELDPDFDLDFHLQRVRLPEPADQAALQDLVSELMSTPLDFTRPLWQYHYVENYSAGSALIARIHHCIADGLALIQVLLSMTDPEPGAEWPVPCEEQPRKLRPLTRMLLPALTAGHRIRHTWRQAESLANSSLQALINPTRLLDAARLTTRGGKAFSKLLLIGPDKKTLFKGKCGGQKKAAWSEPIPVSDMKAIGRLMGGTINDVILSAVTGALRRYLEDKNQPTEGLNIRAVVPVNLREEGDLSDLGNKFGLVFLSLPVGIQDPIKRLIVLKRRMDQIKNSPEAVVAFGILNAIGMTPVQIETLIVRVFAMKGTAVMTNVPGPRRPIYFAGGLVSGVMYWVPQPGTLGMGVSILSYAGGVVLGIATDDCLVGDPETLIQFFYEEVEALKGWGQPKKAPEEIRWTAEPPGESASVEEASPPASSRVNGNCRAMTKSGRPCKNLALPGLSTCRVHKVQEAEIV